MKSIYGFIFALTLSLSLGAAEPTPPSAGDPAAPATAPVAAPEIAPAEKKESKAKPAAKKSKTKAVAKKSDTHTEINPPENAVVKRANANVRGQASFVGEVITKLKKGEPVTLLEEITLGKTRKDEPARWFRIAMPTNTPVWVNALFIDPTSKLVKPKKLQVRAGPGENFSVVGLLQKDTPVKEIRQVNDWIEIETPANAYAFVSADLIERAAPTAPPVPETAPEVVAVPPDVSNVPTPAEPVAPSTPEVAPPVVTPPPVVEEPLPKRVVAREGIVRRSYNVQTPSYYELESPDTKKVINYLYSSQPDFTLKTLIGQRVIVTGEELIDKRWPNTPVIEIESLEQQ